MKYLYVLSILSILLIAPIISASDVTITIPYEGLGITEHGLTNATINQTSTTGNWSQIICILANGFVNAKSMNITYDHTFINNTKYYNYTISNATMNKTLTVNINFTSIHVPPHPESLYIAQLLSEIHNISEALNLSEAQVISLRSMLNTSNQTIETKIAEIDALNTIISSLNNQVKSLTSDITNLTTDIDSLQSEITNLTTILTTQATRITSLESSLKEYKLSTDQLASPFALFYDHPQNGNGQFYVNITSVIIGILLFAVGFFIYNSRSGFSGKKTIMDLGSKVNIPFISKGNKPTPAEWDIIDKDDTPDIEKEFFDKVQEQKPPEPEPQEIETSERSEDSRRSRGVEGKASQNKKTNYWDTPSGQKRRAEIKRLNDELKKNENGE